MTYAQKLKDPRWQKKRLEILSRDNFACWWCNDNKSTLHVHHESYIGDNPWDTPDYCLRTLCEECHQVNHLTFSPLETILITTIRCRSRLDYDKIKLLNKIIRREKGVLIDKDLITEEPF